MNYLLILLLFCSLEAISADEKFFLSGRASSTGRKENAAFPAFAFLYGCGTRVRIAEGFRLLPPDAGPEDCGAPYFLETAGLSDEELFASVRREADHLSVPAMRILALMYFTGRGCERNPAAAWSLWRCAADLGDPVSLAVLAQYEGYDGEESRKRAERMVRSEGRNGGKFRLYRPEIVFRPEPDALSLQLGESVSAFLQRALAVWRKGGTVILYLPDP